MSIRLGAVAAPFDRDLESDFTRIERLVAAARADGVRLLALPEACLGGYLLSMEGRADPDDVPPALDRDGPEIRRLASIAGDMVVCAGYCEAAGSQRYNSVVCVTGEGVLGHHRKVHQPLNEDALFAPGDGFAAFDTPVGRIGMLICYDKAFPESARSLALDGAEIVVCVSAWPASRTNPAPDLAEDRWTRRFDLFDRARALENQVIWLSANQSGTFGALRFVGNAKIVDPGGEIVAGTGVHGGLAVAELDVPHALATARRSMGYLRDRRPDAYNETGPASPPAASPPAASASGSTASNSTASGSTASGPTASGFASGSTASGRPSSGFSLNAADSGSASIASPSGSARSGSISTGSVSGATGASPGGLAG